MLWSRGFAIVGALVLGCAIFTTGEWWSRGIFFGNAPDEKEHYAMVEYVAKHGRLPHYGEPNFTVWLMKTGNRLYAADPKNLRGIFQLQNNPTRTELRQTYLFVPQLPYFLNGWFCRLQGGATPARARAFNSLCVAGAAVLVFLAGLALWPARRLAAWVAGACVGLWPQLCFVGAYVNDDGLALLSVGGLVAACAWCQRGPFARRRAVGLGVALGLLGSCKPYVFAFLPLFVLWFWRWSRSESRSEFRTPHFWRRAGLAAAIAIAIAGPWFVRNAVLYGDPTGHRFLEAKMREFVAMLPQDVVNGTTLLFLKPAKARVDPHIFFGPWLQHSFDSFWARFGWMDSNPTQPLAKIARAVLALGLVLSIRRRTLAAWWNVPGLFGLPALALLLLGSMANSYFVDSQPQGRYLLPAAPGLLLQITGGFATLPPRIVSGVLLLLLLAFFIANNVLCRVTVVH